MFVSFSTDGTVASRGFRASYNTGYFTDSPTELVTGYPHYVVMAYAVMACLYIVMALYSYGLYSCGPM